MKFNETIFLDSLNILSQYIWKVPTDLHENILKPNTTF